MTDDDATASGPRYVAFSGGVGGAKLAFGLSKILPPKDLLIVVNTGDDFEHLGLNICPDIDTILYTLAELNDPARGWGRRNETWHVLEALGAIGSETWFQLGDKDLALHLERTRRLARGESLSQVIQFLAVRLGVYHAVAPMSDQPVRTMLHTEDGALSFQEYFVQKKCRPKVISVSFAGACDALPSPVVRKALSSPNLEGVIFCPSNPLLSIDPILSVNGVRECLRALHAPIIAISPIIAGKTVKGPAVKMLVELGRKPTALTAAELYADLLSAYIIDDNDKDLLEDAKALTPHIFSTSIYMETDTDKISLAKFALTAIDEIRERNPALWDRLGATR